MRSSSATTSTRACSPTRSSSPIVVTVVALVIAFPVAFALTRLSRTWRGIVFACVLLPLWISVLVRTFSWMLLLERNGPINRFIVASGLSDQPLSLLFNHTAVLIGMVHVLLPYAVLPIYAALVRIDPRLLRASEGLGASAVDDVSPRAVPAVAAGVATAATFTFLLALGFFVTPALLGGASSLTLSMLIDGFVSERLDWPLAAAASVVLLAAALVVRRGRRALRSGRRHRARCIDDRAGSRSTPSSRWSRRFWCCRSSPSFPRRSARRASSGCRRTRGRCAGGARSSTTSSWRRHAAREPQGRGAHDARCRSSPERPRRSASRAAARAPRRC